MHARTLQSNVRRSPFCAPLRKLRGHTLYCLATVSQPRTLMTVHIDQTTISFPFTPKAGKELQESLKTLLQTFAAKQKAERPQRWKSLEFRIKGDPELQGLEFLEVFCNPNAAASAFDAKALVTVKSEGGVKVSSEGRLSALKSDLDSFLAQHT